MKNEKDSILRGIDLIISRYSELDDSIFRRGIIQGLGEAKRLVKTKLGESIK